MRLALVPGVGPHIHKALLKRFCCPRSVLSASPAELQTVPGIGAKLSQHIATANHRIDVDGEIQLYRQNDITILTEADTDYPRLLRETPDPPAVLFVQGELLLRDPISVAVVGSRHGSRYGLEQASGWPPVLPGTTWSLAAWRGASTQRLIAGLWRPAVARSPCWPAAF